MLQTHQERRGTAQGVSIKYITKYSTFAQNYRKSDHHVYWICLLKFFFVKRSAKPWFSTNLFGNLESFYLEIKAVLGYKYWTPNQFIGFTFNSFL